MTAMARSFNFNTNAEHLESGRSTQCTLLQQFFDQLPFKESIVNLIATADGQWHIPQFF